ncbi:hypothetical protein QNA24_29775 [Rhodococcus qingshengii]|uniref:hypothetical protein n=1 Tax=Rhodococcus TaxID=1827 RepID=UPI001E33975C|nr:MULTISPECIES: hypothetical protein [Rhodococcus]MCD2099562.1 hypothetical protein [Rhodococcus rhodochrous]MCD2123930.1 hypothetical protein [Rhodococcus rhodochrous]MCQ4136641.1 hypothetical protein [Rhodococcus rhodochrous]MDJ0490573.1 hypothetical protein [Rhodococcus qingshengii]
MSTSFDLYNIAGDVPAGTAHDLICDGCIDCDTNNWDYFDRQWVKAYGVPDQTLNCCGLITQHKDDCHSFRP